MSGTATWLSHAFNVHLPNVNWSTNQGIYIFASVVNDMWFAHYIGQTDNFASRFANHERWDDALRRGVTHIHAMRVPIQAQRNTIEEQLIRAFQPPMNSIFR